MKQILSRILNILFAGLLLSILWFLWDITTGNMKMEAYEQGVSAGICFAFEEIEGTKCQLTK